jgi:predicted MFS family arabinose efflux permease
MSFICAATVANIYYSQPLLADLAQYFQATESTVSIVATLSQVGYGLGVLFLVPLGDIYERRRLILLLLAGVSASLLVAAMAPTLLILSIACLLVGITTIVPQVLIPYAATLARPQERASVIGTIQSGLLIGILLARTVAGAVASFSNWRGIYFVGTAVSVLISGVVLRVLPKQETSSRLSYFKLLKSMLTLLFSESVLRKASLVSALNFAAFGAFWTTLAFLLKASFGYGPGVVGLFGIIGVVGALSASLAGRMSDKKGTHFTQVIAQVVTVLSFAFLAFATHSLILLIIGVIVLDAGVQAVHIACQAEVFSLSAEARSRLNGVYMFLRFLGGASGSLIGGWAWHHWQWTGVCASGVAFCVIGLLPLMRMTRNLKLT